MVKKFLLTAVLVVGALLGVQQASADVYVRGYVRSNGTYVAPHFRSNPDGNFYNNWSTYPNVNPYTGRMGTRLAPSYSPSRSYPSYSLPRPSFPSHGSRSFSPSYGRPR